MSCSRNHVRTCSLLNLHAPCVHPACPLFIFHGKGWVWKPCWPCTHWCFLEATVRSVHNLTPPSNHPFICFSCNHNWETVPSGRICLHNDVVELICCHGNSCYGQQLLWKRVLYILAYAVQLRSAAYMIVRTHVTPTEYDVVE